jgi:hypothetical protein
VALVNRYFKAVPGFTPPEVIVRVSQLLPVLQMLGMGGGDPFYAVIAEKVK